MLATRLLEEGHAVVAFDPKALDNGQGALTGRFVAATSAEDCVQRASLVVIMTPWPEFRAIPAHAFARTPRLSVIDCWRLLSQEEIGPVADLVHLGRGATDGQVALVEDR